jgi:tRNA U38,U39,U40 pseudouridine synthase TruA
MACRNWDDFIRWMASQFRGKYFLSIVVRIMVVAIVHALQHERNARFVPKDKHRSRCILLEILFWVRFKVNSLI